MHWLGIDFGAKMAGTTAVCFQENKCLNVVQSRKNQDADTFIINFIHQHKPELIFIDAPLSLPLAYQSAGNDFFYREADKKLGAMSPLFLGGLTARAMQLAHWCRNNGFEIKETYPAHTALLLFGKIVKGDERIQHLEQWLKQYNLNFKPSCLMSGHASDSVLAWISGKRFTERQAMIAGNPDEGLIIC
jgi:predicted nuclease with RNAse H fold